MYELPLRFFCVTIWVRINGLGKCVYFKRYYDIRLFIRWRWYFEYLAARLKVKYPRCTVKLEWNDNELPDDNTILEGKKRTLVNKLRKCKADITRHSKAIDDVNGKWNEIERQTSQRYINTVNKVNELICKRKNLENEIECLSYQSKSDVFIKNEDFYGIKMRHYGSNGKVNSTHFKFS